MSKWTGRASPQSAAVNQTVPLTVSAPAATTRQDKFLERPTARSASQLRTINESSTQV
jgi:hypothetical protein